MRMDSSGWQSICKWEMEIDETDWKRRIGADGSSVDSGSLEHRVCTFSTASIHPDNRSNGFSTLVLVDDRREEDKP